jgi:glycosyltransferase involved in cell wall biosynthesis
MRAARDSRGRASGADGSGPGPGLRFAMVTTFYPPYHFGGDAIAVQRLSHALAARGHRVDVLHDVDAHRTLHGGPPPEPVEEPPGVRTIPLRSRTGALSALSSLATHQLGRPLVHGREIRRQLEEGGYDVIHYHNVSLVGGPAVLRWGDALKLYLTHEYWLVCPTHGLWRHNREICTARQCVRCGLAYRRPPQPWRRTRLLERCAEAVDVFYAPSRFTAEKHAELGFPRELEVLPYFLPDPKRGAGARTGEMEEAPWPRPYFLFVGRLEKVKGVQDVLPHFRGDAPADLLVVGAGNYEADLRRQARSSERVHFLGFRPAEAIRPLYRHALATVFPTKGYESFGLVIIESHREGTPVIARSRGPIPEILSRSGGGLLFEDDAGLGQALHRIAGEPALREELGRRGRAGFLEHYSESVGLEGFFDLLRRAARRTGRTDLLARLPASP